MRRKELESNLENPEGFNKALKELNKTGRQLSETELFRTMRNEVRKDASRNIQRNLISGGDWQRFREKLLSYLE